MMRGGLGMRIGQQNEQFELRRLQRGALRDLWRRLLGHRRPLFLAIGATLVVAGAGAAGPLFIRLGIDRFIAGGDLSGLIWLAAAYAALQGLAWWGAYWQRLLGERVGQSLTAGMRNDLFRHLAAQGMEFFPGRPVGELVSRLTGDINAVSELAATGTLSIIGDVFGLTAIIVAMFWLDWRLALVALAMVPVVLLSTAAFGRRLRGAYADVRTKAADMGANLQESLAGMRVVQSLGRESVSLERFEQINLYSLQANMYAMLVFALFFPLMTITGNLGTAAVLAYGGHLIVLGATSLGTVAAFMSYIRNFFAPLRELSQVYNSLQAAGASLDRFWGLMQHPPAVTAPAAPQRPARLEGRIEFRQVEFGYTAARPVFAGLDLTIEPGARLAVVGPSGAGKTTLVNLLTRLYDVSGGAVLVDGLDVRAWDPAELRRVVAVVPQEATLFPGTVLENITYGRPDATRAEVEALARDLDVHQLLAGLPKSYETAIGPAAAGRLSGGQRQVIAVLRALLRDPAIVVLDEATSNVDGRTEALINAGLARALAGRTGLVIAHRLRGVSLAGEIAVLDRGALVARGSHDELLERNELYREMYLSQGLAAQDEPTGGGRGRRA